MNETVNNTSLFELNRKFIPEKLLLDRYLSIIWFSIGLPGNLLSFAVWIQPKLRRQNSSAVYLACLSLCDFFVIVYVLCLDMEYAWNLKILGKLSCSITMLLGGCFQFYSPVLVLAFTIERWFAICYPFHTWSVGSPHRSLIVAGILLVFVLSYTFVNGFLWQYDEKSESCSFHLLYNELTFESHYIITSEIIFSVTVPLLILIFNTLVIKELYRITQIKGPQPSLVVTNDNSGNTTQKQVKSTQTDRSFMFTTVMLLSVSFYVFITTLPVGIMYTLQHFIPETNKYILVSEIKNDPVWQLYFRISVVKAIVDELCISHYALNILIYLITGQAFRQTFLQCFNKLIHRISRGNEDEMSFYLTSNSQGLLNNQHNVTNSNLHNSSGGISTRHNSQNVINNPNYNPNNNNNIEISTRRKRREL